MCRLRTRNARGWATTHLAIAAVALPLLGACSTLRMVPPPEIEATSEVHEARGRPFAAGALVDESFAIGPWSIRNVDRDWNRGSELTILGFSDSDVATGYAWEIREGGRSLAGRCASLTNESSLALSDSRSISSAKHRIACTCGDGARTAEIEIEGRQHELTGEARIGGRTFSVAKVTEVNTPLRGAEPVGWRVDDGEEPLGAVEVLHPGRIWLSRTLDEDARRELACLFVGLMLYLEPRDD